MSNKSMRVGGVPFAARLLNMAFLLRPSFQEDQLMQIRVQLRRQSQNLLVMNAQDISTQKLHWLHIKLEGT
eukprot:12408053-Karenia_brevis.AAC.1